MSMTSLAFTTGFSSTFRRRPVGSTIAATFDVERSAMGISIKINLTAVILIRTGFSWWGPEAQLTWGH